MLRELNRLERVGEPTSVWYSRAYMQGNNSTNQSPVVILCERCGGKIMVERFAEGKEFNCLNCGRVTYEEGYKPMELPEHTQRGRGKNAKIA